PTHLPSFPTRRSSDLGDLLDLLAEPAAHLGAGIAPHQVVEIVLPGELVHQLETVAVVEPGVLLAPIEPERDRAEQREGRVLADIDRKSTRLNSSHVAI